MVGVIVNQVSQAAMELAELTTQRDDLSDALATMVEELQEAVEGGASDEDLAKLNRELEGVAKQIGELDEVLDRLQSE